MFSLSFCRRRRLRSLRPPSSPPVVLTLPRMAGQDVIGNKWVTRRERDREGRGREGFRSTPAEWAITAIHSFAPRRRGEEVIKQLMTEGRGLLPPSQVD